MFHGASIIAGGLFLTSMSVRGSGLGTFLLSSFVGLCLFLVWVVRLILSGASSGAISKSKSWLLGPAILATTILLSTFVVNEDTAFHLFRGWVERDARDTAAKQDIPLNGWFGPIPVIGVHRVGLKGVKFSVADTNFFSSSGYAWSPEGKDVIVATEVRPMGGAWYAWETIF